MDEIRNGKGTVIGYIRGMIGNIEVETLEHNVVGRVSFDGTYDAYGRKISSTRDPMILYGALSEAYARNHFTGM